MSERPTPETDAESKRTAGIGAMSGMDQAWEDMVYFAKDLERERDEISKLNHGQFLQLEYLHRVEVTYELYSQAEEYDFPDGLGQGAAQELWDALAAVFEPETEAIADEIRARKGEHDEQH